MEGSQNASLIERGFKLLLGPTVSWRISQRSAFWAVVATMLVLFLWVASASSWAHSVDLPHNAQFDELYYLLDPVALYLLTGFLTFTLVCWPPNIPFSEWSTQKRELRSLPIRAVILLTVSTVLLTGVEYSLKRGLSKARPVAQAEHLIAAAKLQNWLFHAKGFVPPTHFECPVAQFIFDGRFKQNGDALADQLAAAGVMSKQEAENHVNDILKRKGMDSEGVDIDTEISLLERIAPWRAQKLSPFLSAWTPTFIGVGRVDDLEGAAPSGHMLRQTFIFFLFCFVALKRAPTRLVFPERELRRRRAWWVFGWSMLGVLQLLALATCAWSRVYSYDHTWSDEIISFALGLGMFSFSAQVRRAVLDSAHGIFRILEGREASDLMQSVRLMVVAFDNDEKVVLWNQEAERVTGYLRHEIPNLTVYVSKVHRYQDPISIRKRILRMFSERVRNVIVSITAKDRTPKLIVWSGTPIPTNDGSVSGKIFIGYEISAVDRRLADVGAAAKGLVRKIRAQLASLTNNDVAASSPAVTATFKKISDMCQSFRDYVDDNRSDHSPMTPSALINCAFTAVETEASQRSVELRKGQIDDSAVIRAEEYRIRHALIDLVRHAVRSASIRQSRIGIDSRPFINVSARYEGAGGQGPAFIHFEVAYSGPPVPIELKRWLCPSPMYEDAGDAQHQIGLGLLLANIAAKENNGWIRLIEEAEVNVIELVLPVFSAPNDSDGSHPVLPAHSTA